MNKTIILKFKDKETADYVRLICKRKGITLEDYIIDNFEWDDEPYCFYYGQGAPLEVNSDVCDGCEYLDTCPDAVKELMKVGEPPTAGR